MIIVFTGLVRTLSQHEEEIFTFNVCNSQRKFEQHQCDTKDICSNNNAPNEITNIIKLSDISQQSNVNKKIGRISYKKSMTL